MYASFWDCFDFTACLYLESKIVTLAYVCKVWDCFDFTACWHLDSEIVILAYVRKVLGLFWLHGFFTGLATLSGLVEHMLLLVYVGFSSFSGCIFLAYMGTQYNGLCFCAQGAFLVSRIDSLLYWSLNRRFYVLYERVCLTFGILSFLTWGDLQEWPSGWTLAVAPNKKKPYHNIFPFSYMYTYTCIYACAVTLWTQT